MLTTYITLAGLEDVAKIPPFLAIDEGEEFAVSRVQSAE